MSVQLVIAEKPSVARIVSHSKAMGLVRSTIEIGVLVGSFFLSKWVMPYTVLAGLLARKAADECTGIRIHPCLGLYIV